MDPTPQSPETHVPTPASLRTPARPASAASHGATPVVGPPAPHITPLPIRRSFRHRALVLASQRGRLQPPRKALHLPSPLVLTGRPLLHSRSRLSPIHARPSPPSGLTDVLPWLRTSLAAPTASALAHAPALLAPLSRPSPSARRSSTGPLPLCSNGAPPSPPTSPPPTLVKAPCSSASTAPAAPSPSSSPRPLRQALLRHFSHCTRCCHLSVALLLEP